MFALATLLLTLAPGVAQAQEPTAAEIATARRLFEEGMSAARQEQWEQAREAFERSYALVRRPRILANLGTAQAHTGRLVEAAESYRSFLREATAGPDAAARPNVERELAAVEARLAELRISVDGLRPSDAVLLDGQQLRRAVLDVPMPANPGAHEVAVMRGGEHVQHERFTLAEGERRHVRVEVPRVPDPSELPAGEPPATEPVLSGTSGALAAGDADDEADGGGVLSSPVFWLVVGVVVAGGVTAGIVLASGEDAPPSGTFGAGRWTID